MFRGRIRRLTSPFVLLLTVGLALTPLTADAAPPSIAIEDIDIGKTQVVAPNGERGAALAQLRDGRLLLGGGPNGSTLFLFDREQSALINLGTVIKESERLNDSRFAITDIGILAEKENVFSLLISFPQYRSSGKCVSLVLFQYALKLGVSPKLTRGKQWFRSNPCVPIRAVQHAAGRIEIIDSTSTYLTTGDFGYPKINDRTKRGTLGCIYKVSSKSAQRISQGHRNPQGVVLIGSDLYISEHGPRGGDELNVVENGQDYGWPFVTYGEPYGSGDYVIPTKTGTHQGFTKPLYYWVPSVAPTELVQLPKNSNWGMWAGEIVMGTLRENSLVFIQLTSKKSVGEVSTVNVGERIRDLEVDSQGTIIATTDSGELLLVSPK
jgi:hypothetical protein